MSNLIQTFTDVVVDYLLFVSAFAAVSVPLAWTVIKLARMKAAIHRHMIWLSLLIAIAVLPALCLHCPKLAIPILPQTTGPVEPIVIPVVQERTVIEVVPSETDASDISEAVVAPVQWPVSTDANLQTWTPQVRTIFAGLWFIGVSFMLARLATGWIRLERICRSAAEASTTGPLATDDKFGIRVLLTPMINGAVCFGLFRPVIVLPGAIVEETDRANLEMILTHELAHIQRRDHWINILQQLIEALFFFHPMIWYASFRLTQEREYICDNHVLAKGASAEDYVEMLSRIAERGRSERRLQAVALFEGRLLARVRRMLDPGHSGRTRPSPWAKIVCTAGVLLCTTFAVVRLQARLAADRSINKTTAVNIAEADDKMGPYDLIQDIGGPLKVVIIKQPEVLEKDNRYIGPGRVSAQGNLNYVVCPNLLGEGERLYTDRDYVFAGVPRKYRGLTYIRTCQDDKISAKGFDLTLQVNTPVILYVARDDRLKVVPTWLQAFRDTGDDVTTNDPYEPKYSVYSKAFPAGKIVLGPNEGAVISCMYSVFLEEIKSPASDSVVLAVSDKIEGEAPLEVKFRSAMLSGVADGKKYHWDFGDGSEKSAEQQPVHTYAKDGRYLAMLTVADSGGIVGTAKVGIYVLPPIASTYKEAFSALHKELGHNYPCFDLKGIDWTNVGQELIPRADKAKTNEEFGLICLELVARLQDSHAYLMPGKAKVPIVPFPQWDAGFACLIDDRGKPVVYCVDEDSPAKSAGMKVGMTVLSVDGEPAEEYMQRRMKEIRKYSGYSSQRYLQYHAAQWIGRQITQGSVVEFKMQDHNGKTYALKPPAELGGRYLPRRPVQIRGTSDTANVSWTRLDNEIGYIYVRRIRNDLITQLDRAVDELKDAQGLIVDVRGNSGGGFDSTRSHLNFALDDNEETGRPIFKGLMALLIDARCISAGEGWASWFIAKKRAKVFGEATAGASSRKTVYALTNGLFKVQYPVKAYTGYLQRPIEHRGLEPDVPVRQNARDLALGRDAVLNRAMHYLLDQTTNPRNRDLKGVIDIDSPVSGSDKREEMGN